MPETDGESRFAHLFNVSLCYYVEASAGQKKIVTPIVTMPDSHPAVELDPCETGLQAGDRIPLVTRSNNNHAQVCEDTLGPVMFYGWGYPQPWVANTGFANPNKVSLYMLADAADVVYLLMTMSEPHASTDPGYFGFDLYAGGLGPENALLINGTLRPAGVIFLDDEYEYENCGCPEKSPLGPWNTTTQEGSFYWEWKPFGSDGLVFGPMPAVDWDIVLVVNTAAPALTHLSIGSYEPLTHQLGFVDVPIVDIHGATDGWLFMQSFSCWDLCQSLTSCGECTAAPACGWCGDECVPNTAPRRCNEI